MSSFKKFDADRAKMRELILYVSEKSAGHRLFGKTKLNKILYFVDFIAFRNLGSPITGFRYLKAPHGPVPKKIDRELSRLCFDEDLAIPVERVYQHWSQERPESLRSPDMREFSNDEMEIIDFWIEELKDASAADVSDMSHELGGWKYADDWGVIPFESVYLDNEPMTEEECERGREIVREWNLP